MAKNVKKGKLSGKAWALIIVVVLALFVAGRVWYDGYVFGEINLTNVAPGNEELDYIAANWKLLEARTDLFTNLMATPEEETEDPGTEAAAETTEPAADNAQADMGIAYLQYIGESPYEEVWVYVNTAEMIEDTEPAAAQAVFARTTLADCIDGKAPWGQTTTQFQVGNSNCLIEIYDENAVTTDATALKDILAVIESVIGKPAAE